MNTATRMTIRKPFRNGVRFGQTGLAAALLIIGAMATGVARANSLVVIAPEVFQEALQPLIDHKNNTGMPAALVTLEAIEAEYEGTGHDIAERVKFYLADAYAPPQNVRYAMLVGDADRFPIRWVTRYLWNQDDRVRYHLPSDLYYADLFKPNGEFDNWDLNGNGRFAEFGGHNDLVTNPYSVNRDQITLYPDIAVGRVPAHSVAEVRHYVAKVIRYEYLTRIAEGLYNFLYIAGDGRYCDAPRHFFDIRNVMPWFNFRAFVHNAYYDFNEKKPCRPGIKLPGEFLYDAMQRTGLDAQQLDWMEEVPRWTRAADIPGWAFANNGFYFWYDHTHSTSVYNRFNSSALYPIVYSSGCADGGFAGWEPGTAGRFFEQNLPYLTTAGDTISICFEPRQVVKGGETKIILVASNTCMINGVSYPLNTLLDLYPDLEVYCDTGGYGVPIRPHHTPHIVNIPMPAPLQPIDSVPRFTFAPETTLLQLYDGDGTPAGWIGMVGAMKGTSFPGNGEMGSMFFNSMFTPHPVISEHPGGFCLGDMWRSMLHYWLDMVFDEDGQFAFTGYMEKYNMCHNEFFRGTCVNAGIEDTLQAALFGDPSLRVGGAAGISDTMPPFTSHDAPYPASWINRRIVNLHATDFGSPPSGIYWTRHRIGSAGHFQMGTEVVFPSDGIFDMQYQSQDIVGNLEAVQSQEVWIETVPPESAVAFEGESAEIALGGESDDIPWFHGTVTLVVTSVDPGPHASGVRRLWYRIRGGGGGTPYGQFMPLDGSSNRIAVAGHEVAMVRYLDFFSEDWAGNLEETKTQPFRVSGRQRVGRIVDACLIQSAWRDIAALQLTQRLIDTLPPINHVVWDYRLPGVGQWIDIGASYSGENQWEVKWFTHLVPNGTYEVRTRVFGELPLGGMTILNHELLHEEMVTVEVCNLLPSDFNFELRAPAVAQPGETIEYEIEIENLTGESWTGADLRCVVDLGALIDLDVLDDGYLDPKEGFPRWNFSELVPDKPQIVRFSAKVADSLPPGYVIRGQAQIAAGSGVFLISRNPALPGNESSTDVTLPWVTGSLVGTVHSEDGLAIVGDVLLDGPVSRTTQSAPETGAFAFDELPRGTYELQVQAGKEYQDPLAPRMVEMSGMGHTVSQSVVMVYLDITPPRIWIETENLRLPDNQGFGTLTGQAEDPHPGSGVVLVEVMVRRESDGKYWSGTAWTSGPIWRTASGTTEWSLNCSMLPADDEYRFWVRAWDAAGNVSQVELFRTHETVSRPSLIWPENNATISPPARLSWDDMADCEYFVQVSTLPDFSNLLRNAAHVQDSELSLGTLPDGLYYWRVQAANQRHGTPVSRWSDVRSFSLASTFKITGIERDPVTGETKIGWQGPADALYWVQEAEKLLPGSAFRYRSSSMPGQPEENVYTLPDSPAEGAFFRILGY